MEKYVIGMDGGGTGTTVLLADMHANKKQRFAAGALNVNGQSEQDVLKTFTEISYRAASMGYKKEDCQGICIGTAGISNMAAKEFIKKSAAAFTFSDNIKIVGDHEAALAGAVGSRTGIIVIAGTGSICFGVDREGNSYRSGGYGHLIDDVGSGYAIARDILTNVIRAHDRRRPATVLTQLVFDALKIQEIEELIEYIYDSRRNKKEIAALSVLLTQAVKCEDEAAVGIVLKSARDLVELTGSVIEQVGKEATLAVSGSVLLNNKEIYSTFRRELFCRYPDIKVIKPKEEAAYGAVKIILDSFAAGNGVRADR